MFHGIPGTPPGDDGDALRAIGFLTLYMVHLEDSVDECAGALGLEVTHADYRALNLSAKIDRCERALRKKSNLYSGVKDLPIVLEQGKALFVHARDSIHEFIYGMPSVDTMLDRGYTGKADVCITSGKLYALVGAVASKAVALMQMAMITIPRFLLSRDVAA
jgi:hypothetical protein